MQCTGRQHEDHFVLVADGLTRNAASTASLCAVNTGGNAFDVALLSEGDQNGFIGHQVFFFQFLVSFTLDLGTAFVAVFSGQLVEVSFDHFKHLLGVGQKFFQVGNTGEDLFIFRFDLLAFQSGQTA
ncbi:hypothetical protein SDC9_65843 [bioreactor metagenome]|uniref:Uncharacterized protein n=1 Tax=bioreactor metagenome TaxID=1076179 RepID=A0A644XTK0_9ZZZZ